ncbi:bacillithiol biosynthesis BshC [Candidatus Bipolaricaulota bacterium]
MMSTQVIDPATLYADNRLFLDFLTRREALNPFFEREPAGFRKAAEARTGLSFPREALRDALLTYNRGLGASEQAIENVRGLAEPGTLCVLTGQQAGFLGGPTYTAYKILTAVRLARSLTDELNVPVVPVFWLASEDHDFTEINRVRWPANDGALRTVSFDWEGRGRAIEALPMTENIRATALEVIGELDVSPDVAALLADDAAEDYAAWHARIWCRLFAGDGLILVEPRVVRPLSASFFRDAIAGADAIRASFEQVSTDLQRIGYAPALDPARAGIPFLVTATGERLRADRASLDAAAGGTYSADAALRPVLADTLFPTVASVLGPGEIAYHAQLRPLYDQLSVPQPVFVPRHGYTLLSAEEADLLERLAIPQSAALSADFDPQPALGALISDNVRGAFSDARDRVRDGLAELLPIVQGADPGLEARWRQVADRAARELEQLEDRVGRAELARVGISVKKVRALLASLRPGGQPQERAISLVYFLARFGIQWLHRLPGADQPDRFSHYVVTIHGQA